MIHPHNNPKCDQCGEELKKAEHVFDFDGRLKMTGTCWICEQLENNRRRRLANQIGEYSPEMEAA